MLQPTWNAVWLSENAPDYVNGSQHTWDDLVLLGYGNYLPLVSLILTVASLGMICWDLVKNRVGIVPVVTLVLGAVLVAVFGYNGHHAGFATGMGQYVAPLLGFGALVLLLGKRPATSYDIRREAER